MREDEGLIPDRRERLSVTSTPERIVTAIAIRIIEIEIWESFREMLLIILIFHSCDNVDMACSQF